MRILEEGIIKCINHSSFIDNMSVGYTQLMNKIGLLHVIFKRFEKYVIEFK